MAEEVYRYYVVYQWSGPSFQWRVGRCFTSTDAPLDNQAIIEQVQHKIELDNGWDVDSVTLLNWKRLQ